MMRTITGIYVQAIHTGRKTDAPEFEVVVEVNGQGRRICTCVRESDGADIAEALRYAHKNGIV